MNNADIKTLALDWMDAWNKRDIDRVMNHYTDDIVFYSLTVIKRWDMPDGKIQGREKLRAHFLKSFELFPALHFEYVDILYGVDEMIIVYKRETGALAGDVIQLNADKKCVLVKAYYSK
jgi:hypothetical protein